MIPKEHQYYFRGDLPKMMEWVEQFIHGKLELRGVSLRGEGFMWLATWDGTAWTKRPNFDTSVGFYSSGEHYIQVGVEELDAATYYKMRWYQPI